MEEKYKILIVDDEQDIRQILTILLTGEGYEVVCACNSEEAIKLVDETIALILLDVNMPGKSGFVACSEIRQRWQVPILFLTAYGQESDKESGSANDSQRKSRAGNTVAFPVFSD